MKKRRIFIAILAVAVCVVAAMNFTRILQKIPTDFSDIQMTYDADGRSRYYFNTLSAEGKVAYTVILDTIREHPERIEIPQLNDADFHEMFCALSYDNPELLCMTNESQIVMRGAKAYFVPQYCEELSVCESHRNDLENAVTEILSGVTPNMDAYDTELYFHDVICEKVVYTPDGDNVKGYSAYDALVQGKAVCEGYSRSVQLLLNRVGISNYLVTGIGADSDGTSEGHMWNVVTLQGENYYLDVTWDDMDEDDINRYNHTYFNVTSADIEKNHLEIQPANNCCTATAYNYFVRQGLCISKYDANAKSLLVQEIRKAAENGSDTFEIRFAGGAAYEKAVTDLIDNDQISDLVHKAERGAAIHYKSVMYVYDADMFTLQFSFSE